MDFFTFFYSNMQENLPVADSLYYRSGYSLYSFGVSGAGVSVDGGSVGVCSGVGASVGSGVGVWGFSVGVFVGALVGASVGACVGVLLEEVLFFVDAPTLYGSE